MSKYFRPWNIDQTLLLPPNVQDFVPKGHVSRFIVELVRESLDLKEITGSYVSGLGQPPFDPRMMVALLLHGYASGLYSSRRIAKACRERNDFVMIVALDPPDFRTISDFRKRHLKALGELFLQVLKLCETAGLVKLGHVALDGTKIKANASKHKAMSYERMKKRESELKAEVACMLAAAEAADAEEDETSGKDKRGDEMPDWAGDKQKRLAKIQQAMAALEADAKLAAEEERRIEAKKQQQRQAEGRKKPGKPAAPPSDQPDPKSQRNFTDPESRIMKSKDGFVQAYNAQAAVDAGAQIIVAHELTQCGNDQGHQLALIVAALRQFVRDNDLGACVDGGLCIIGLNEAILRLHDAAFRIGEVALRLGIGLVRWRCRRFARLLAAFGLALLFLFGLDATLFLRRQPGLGLQRRHRLLDLHQPFLLVAGPIRHLVAALVSAESLVLFGIRSLRRRQHAGNLGLQFHLALLHALIAHRLVFRGVGFDLRAIERDMAEFDQPRRLAQLQNLQEQGTERLQMPLAEVADRTKIRWIERHNHHKIIPLAAGFRNPTRRIQPTCIAMQQKRHHHPRVKRRLPKPAHIAARDPPEIEALPHQFNDKPRDMAFRHEVLHIRRQQQRLIDIPGAKILAHSPRLNQTRSELNSRYSDRLLVLLRHKFLRGMFLCTGVAQHGHRGEHDVRVGTVLH